MQTQRSYFGFLGADAAANAFRHLSDRPNHPCWPHWVECHDLLSALRARGFLLEAARNAVTQVCTQRTIWEDFFFEVPLPYLREILLAIGNKLKVLHIANSDPTQDVEECRPWMRALGASGIVLRELDISSVADALLEEAILWAVLGQVECLSVPGCHVQKIANHFAGLRDLVLSSVPERDTTGVWRARGPTLESLSIRGMMADIYKDTLGSIQTFCRRLTSFEIDFVEDLWEPHVELFMSYGAQLQHAMFANRNGGIPPAKQREILSVCPNVQCDDVSLVRMDTLCVQAMAERMIKINEVTFLVGNWKPCMSAEISKERACLLRRKIPLQLFKFSRRP